MNKWLFYQNEFSRTSLSAIVTRLSNFVEKNVFLLFTSSRLHIPVPGESLPTCRGLWGTLHTGDNIDCVSSGRAKSRTHQFAVNGFLVTRRGWPGRLRACRIWTFINSV